MAHSENIDIKIEQKCIYFYLYFVGRVYEGQALWAKASNSRALLQFLLASEIHRNIDIGPGWLWANERKYATIGRFSSAVYYSSTC